MVDILHNQQLAQVVAIQGVSPAFQDQLPPESVAAIQQYEESPYAEVYRRTAEGAYGHSDQYYGVSPGRVKGGGTQQNPPGLGQVTLRHTAQRAPQ